MRSPPNGLDNEVATKGLDNEVATKGLDNEVATKGLDKEVATKGLDNEVATKNLDNEVSTKGLDNEVANNEVTNNDCEAAARNMYRDVGCTKERVNTSGATHDAPCPLRGHTSAAAPGHASPTTPVSSFGALAAACFEQWVKHTVTCNSPFSKFAASFVGGAMPTTTGRHRDALSLPQPTLADFSLSAELGPREL
jgi:hypothetical protein